MTRDWPRDDGPRIEELGPDRARLAAEPFPSRHVAGARLEGVPIVVVRAAVLVALLVAVAVAKPWSSPSAPDAPDRTADAAVSGAARGPAAAAIAPQDGPIVPVGPFSPSAAPTPLPRGAVACGTPLGWRLVTVGKLAGRPVEAQTVVDPVAGAAGPTDPGIPVLPAGEAPLAAAGACRPSAAPGVADDRTVRPPALVVGAWRLVGQVAEPLTLSERGVAASTSDIAQLYTPADALGAGWGPGRYVLEVAVADLSVPAWLGFEVTPLPTPRP